MKRMMMMMMPLMNEEEKGRKRELLFLFMIAKGGGRVGCLSAFQDRKEEEGAKNKEWGREGGDV